MTAVLNISLGWNWPQAFGFDTKTITPISIDQSDLKVRRPKNMSLDVSKFEKVLSERLPTVDESIREYKRLHDEGYQQKLRRNLKL